MRIRYLSAVAAVLCAGFAYAQAYKWVDADGVVHYSDRPQPGAEEVALPNQPRRQGLLPARAPANAAGNEEEAPDEPFSYETFEVASPAPEETLWNIEGALTVNLNLQPALRAGDQIRVYFDGQPRMVTSTSFQLDQVYRGAHNLQAEVIDANGQLMIRSQPGRFYIQQTRVAP